MITNREEVIDRAFGVFVKMNYEKASITTLAKACGLTKTGITYYFPHKQDLFIATADKFLFYMQSPTNKFKVDTETLEEFIEEYIKGITSAMGRIVGLIDDGNNPFDCSLNFYYFHFLSQVRMYYPNIRQKIEELYQKDYDQWRIVLKKAKENGEIREETDIDKTAVLFRNVFMGMSYEHAFLNGLNVHKLAEEFKYIYFLLKA